MAEDFLVEHPDAAGGDGAEGEFLIAGDAQLAHDKDIEGQVESERDLVGHGHAATGETEHLAIGLATVAGELIREHLAGVTTITKERC